MVSWLGSDGKSINKMEEARWCENDRLVDCVASHGPPTPPLEGPQALLSELRKQQAAHERRIEAIISRQEASIVRHFQEIFSSVVRPPAFAAPTLRVQRTSTKAGDGVEALPGSAALPNQVPETVPQADTQADTDSIKEVTPNSDAESGNGSTHGATHVTDQDVEDQDAEESKETTSIGRSETAQSRPRHTVVRKEDMAKFADHKTNKDQIKQFRNEVIKGQRTSTSIALEVDDLGYVRGGAKFVVANRRFEMGVCFIVLANAIMIGCESDHELAHPGEKAPLVFRVSNIVFIALFTVELILRIVYEGCGFLHWENPKFLWNIFDTFLVASAFFEEFLRAFTSSSPDLSVMRILRTLRVVRGFRIVRVFSFFRDLRIMVAGIVHSLYSLTWATLLLLSMMYLFAVCLIQFTTGEHVAWTSNNTTSVYSSRSLQADDYKAMMHFYGSLPKTMYTLYCSIVGGIDWEEASDPLMKLSVPLGLLFLLYIAFAVLCVLNIITGVFVENANRTTEQDEEMVMMEQMEKRQAWFDEVQEHFEAHDSDGSGQLDQQEFKRHLEDVRTQAWFRKIGVHVESYSADGLFSLLDLDGDGKLDLDEFSMALRQVHGHARSIDMAKVNRDTKILRKELGELTALCNTFFQRCGLESH